MVAQAQNFLNSLKAQNVAYLDFRFTDSHGTWHHLTYHIDAVDTEVLLSGIMFDGSSVPGWRPINESDMNLRPDLSTAVLDPFAANPTIIINCDVIDPLTNDLYSRDPRSVALKGEVYLRATGIADTAYFGPEPEFFVFDHVEYGLGMEYASYKVDSFEGPYNSNLSQNNPGHRPGVKGGYFPVSPVDVLGDMRAEMLSTMAEMGLKVEKHHHEVAPSQHELGYRFGTLVKAADELQIYKYVVKNVAHAYGKTATFMPKPIMGDNGSGMHVHQSLWKDGQALFKGDKYAGLSETALYYIGGIIKHANALNAFTNPTTNSYKRLVPGFEAPVILAYAARNRSASIRIPHISNPNARRIEVRFPDPTANGYLSFTAMMMAGLDGIKNEIHPGEAATEDLYYSEAAKNYPEVCGSLRQALESLEKDHEFLCEGDVFTKDYIQSYIACKMEEVVAFEQTPHPLEFKMYYSR